MILMAAHTTAMLFRVKPTIGPFYSTMRALKKPYRFSKRTAYLA